MKYDGGKWTGGRHSPRFTHRAGRQPVSGEGPWGINLNLCRGSIDPAKAHYMNHVWAWRSVRSPRSPGWMCSGAAADTHREDHRADGLLVRANRGQWQEAGTWISWGRAVRLFRWIEPGHLWEEQIMAKWKNLKIKKKTEATGPWSFKDSLELLSSFLQKNYHICV